ncbi:MAG: hypothetical protein H6822_15535 [Planctomycetaceae bacterium]|nr:hypothetical protein [Planctomycetales bacterium]MCB9923593.1 hypothetical protein [Planctomycetaceae bacterium]
MTLSFLVLSVHAMSRAQDEASSYESPSVMESELLPSESVLSADLRITDLDAHRIIGATLCFAVGFGACLLIVHYMLPSLVHAQCVEIVREYMAHAPRDADVRVVFLDREGHELLQRPRRVTAPSTEPTKAFDTHVEHRHRVDPATASPGHTLAPKGGKELSDSMLSEIYRQNLHLRDQMQQQSRSVKQQPFPSRPHIDSETASIQKPHPAE